MQFDDRLATVLRMRAASDAVLRTQFRQLLDLLGTAPAEEVSELFDAAYDRLWQLMNTLPSGDQSRILREPGLRLRNPRLVAFLAEGEPRPAASALATARLTDTQWTALIPRLPVTARGFLRHRRDLPEGGRRVLARLGVGDLVLPDPSKTVELAASLAEQAPAQDSPPAEEEGIGAILRRIEAFRETRRSAPSAPRLPVGKGAPGEEQLESCEFATDATGCVTWASAQIAPFLVGLELTAPHPALLIQFEPAAVIRLRSRLPLHAMKLELNAAPAICGAWRIDAAPGFDPHSGAFTGYHGRLHRPVVEKVETAEPEQDLMRQVLHELRTPVGAIQGFAEIIQQQLFGPAPHEYRAHAAAIAVDAAKLLAGFDEVDRLVKLESDALALDEGESDLRAALVEILRRLEGVLEPRGAGFDLSVSGSPFDVGIARTEALALCWRILASAAAALAPREHVALTLESDGSAIRLSLDLPQSLRDPQPDERRDNARRPVLSAGMFGPAFTFRLAQAEARAAGGSLASDEHRLTLVLPALTSAGGDHSKQAGAEGG